MKNSKNTLDKTRTTEEIGKDLAEVVIKLDPIVDHDKIVAEYAKHLAEYFENMNKLPGVSPIGPPMLPPQDWVNVGPIYIDDPIPDSVKKDEIDFMKELQLV